MRKLSVRGCGRALDRFCLLPAGVAAAYTSSCLCNNHVFSAGEDSKPLIPTQLKPRSSSSMKLKDAIAGPPTLAFQLKPKKVVLRVSMHCGGCARKVEKHISKLEGVTSYEVDLETKMVVVTGDIVPFEVLESVSKVKNAELWNTECL